MALVSGGMDVYSSEVDDHGIDFVVKVGESRYLDIQVKSIRGMKYIFFPKSQFTPRKNLYAAVVVYIEEEDPHLFLIPSVSWLKPNALMVERNYGGLKSHPEWGLNISVRNWPLLARYRLDSVMREIK